VNFAIEAGHPAAQSQAHRWRYQREGLSQQTDGWTGLLCCSRQVMGQL